MKLVTRPPDDVKTTSRAFAPCFLCVVDLSPFYLFLRSATQVYFVMRGKRRRQSGGTFLLPLLFFGVWIGLFGLGWVALHFSMTAGGVPATLTTKSESEKALFPKTVPHNNLQPSAPPPPPPPPSLVLLTTPEKGTRALADVRGNLGPAMVVLENQTADWLKDRWQAASDMHGTAIKGQHWIHIVLGRQVRVHSFLLDWETAYADDYYLEGWHNNQSVVTYFDAQHKVADEASSSQQQQQRRTHSFGQSPGVKQKLPLHIIHEIDCPTTTTSTLVDELRLVIQKPFHPSWGVSLWRFQAFGHEVS